MLMIIIISSISIDKIGLLVTTIITKNGACDALSFWLIELMNLNSIKYLKYLTRVYISYAFMHMITL